MQMNNLTDREKEILHHLKTGKANKEIAENLFISADTVKKHLVNIYRKLKVRNRTEASLLSLKNS